MIVSIDLSSREDIPEIFEEENLWPIVTIFVLSAFTTSDIFTAIASGYTSI